MPEEQIQIVPENKLKIVGQAETRVNLVEIAYEDKTKGIKSYGCLFMNDAGKMEFEGDNIEESARMFFEECLKPICEKHIELIIDKRQHPLFYWKENI